MAFVEIAPTYAEPFQRQGLGTARAFLALRGAIIGGHADRQVLTRSARRLRQAADIGHHWTDIRHPAVAN